MLERITVNLSGAVRRITKDGREYLVAPLSLIVPGVLNGSNGPLYYPPEEISKDYTAWNDVPLVVYHPTVAGRPVSARTPGIPSIGRVRNVQVNGKLVAEGWFDQEELQRTDLRVFHSLQAGRPMELSTGLVLDVDETPGEYKGRSYTGIARNYRPDHVAILPDEVGACSLRDGCGLLINHRGPSMHMIRVVNAETAEMIEPAPYVDTDQRSLDDIREGLAIQLKGDRFGTPDEERYVVEVFADSFIYYKDGKLWQVKYAVKDGIVTILDGAAREVQMFKQYVPVPAEPNVGQIVNKKKEIDMAKKELVDSLIANCDCWAEADRETLNALSDEKLTALNAHVAKHLELVKNQKEDEDEEDEEDMKKEKEPVANERKTVKEWWDEAPPELKQVVNRAQAWENDQKKKAVDAITANERNTLTAEQLQGLSLEQLQGIASLVQEPAPKEDFFPSFLGAAAPVANARKAAVETPLPLPKMDYSKAS